ncbi:general secretion pathway protein GspB [Vibrio sonorensis]|uniref:general secretion pathway protein GspB n=1 Tax=Vibrio sonorensis TaxID=1004316 RepID=UPI0008D9B853|nr:general secretion pathway protein GspB [Vibrio sonorensis]
MSKVMEALAQSEQGYQQSNLSEQVGFVNASAKHSNRIDWIKNGLLILTPMAIAALWSSYQSYQDLVIARVNHQPDVQRVSIEVGGEKLTYPSLNTEGPTPLRQTLEVQVPSNPSLSVVKEPVTPLEPQTATQEPFSELDLSQLSPELARKVESALASVESEEKRQAETINLQSHAHQYYGKLPKMNFQTHVYASESRKRWIKVNGIEYREGDWIDGAVEVVSIEPQSTLVKYGNDIISIPALYEWQG